LASIVPPAFLTAVSTAALADGVTLTIYKEEVPKFKAAWAGAGVIPIKTSNPNMAEITRIVDFLNMHPLAIL
jgi:hypothetical protein